MTYTFIATKDPATGLPTDTVAVFLTLGAALVALFPSWRPIEGTRRSFRWLCLGCGQHSVTLRTPANRNCGETAEHHVPRCRAGCTFQHEQPVPARESDDFADFWSHPVVVVARAGEPFRDGMRDLDPDLTASAGHRAEQLGRRYPPWGGGEMAGDHDKDDLPARPACPLIFRS